MEYGFFCKGVDQVVDVSPGGVRDRVGATVVDVLLDFGLGCVGRAGVSDAQSQRFGDQMPGALNLLFAYWLAKDGLDLSDDSGRGAGSFGAMGLLRQISYTNLLV